MIDWNAIAKPPRPVNYSLRVRPVEVDRAKSRKDHDLQEEELHEIDHGYFFPWNASHEVDVFDNRRGAK